MARLGSSKYAYLVGRRCRDSSILEEKTSRRLVRFPHPSGTEEDESSYHIKVGISPCSIIIWEDVSYDGRQVLPALGPAAYIEVGIHIAQRSQERLRMRSPCSLFLSGFTTTIQVALLNSIHINIST